MLRRKMFERISGGSAAIGESFSVDMADICVRSGVCLSPASDVSDRDGELEPFTVCRKAFGN